MPTIKTKTIRRHKIAHSAVIRRVKQRKSKKAKHHKRKTHKRNIVMRGGGNDDKLSLYSEYGPTQPKCIIFIFKTKSLMMSKVELYLFFAADITSQEVKEYVCHAMGLEPNVTFNPDFTIQPGNPDELNNLFIKLSSGGIINNSYTIIESGYLNPQDDNNSIINASQKHEPTPKISLGPKSWNDILNNLKNKGHEFSEFEKFNFGNKLNNFVVRNGNKYANGMNMDYYDVKCKEQKKKIWEKIDEGIKNIIFKNWNENKPKLIRIHDNLAELKKYGRQKGINDIIKKNILGGIDKYDNNVLEIQKYIPNLINEVNDMEYEGLTPDCKKWFIDTELDRRLPKNQTVAEMVDAAYATGT